MSRIGKQPVPVPEGVTVQISGSNVVVKGKGGELKMLAHPNMKVRFDAAAKQIVVERPDDTGVNRALHGLTRALLNNMVVGVVTPFEKKLEIVGVGYVAAIAGGGKFLDLQVGYANTIRLPIPSNVTCKLTDPTHIVLTSTDKQAVGQFAAVIRMVRKPEPYKGKGIKYAGEVIRRKAGKAFAGGG